MAVLAYGGIERPDGLWLDIAENYTSIAHAHLNSQYLVTRVPRLHGIKQGAYLRQRGRKRRQWRRYDRRR